MKKLCMLLVGSIVLLNNSIIAMDQLKTGQADEAQGNKQVQGQLVSEAAAQQKPKPSTAHMQLAHRSSQPTSSYRAKNAATQAQKSGQSSPAASSGSTTPASTASTAASPRHSVNLSAAASAVGQSPASSANSDLVSEMALLRAQLEKLESEKKAEEQRRKQAEVQLTAERQAQQRTEAILRKLQDENVANERSYLEAQKKILKEKEEQAAVLKEEQAKPVLDENAQMQENLRLADQYFSAGDYHKANEYYSKILEWEGNKTAKARAAVRIAYFTYDVMVFSRDWNLIKNNCTYAENLANTAHIHVDLHTRALLAALLGAYYFEHMPEGQRMTIGSQAFQYFEKAAYQCENPWAAAHAALRLGEMYDLHEARYEKAADLYKIAENQTQNEWDRLSARYRLGCMHYSDPEHFMLGHAHGVAENDCLAFDYLKSSLDYIKSAYERNVVTRVICWQDQVYLLLGDMYYYGRGGAPKNYAEASKLYDRARKSDDIKTLAYSCQKLGDMLYHGYYLEKNYGKAREFYECVIALRPIVDWPFLNAHVMLGEIYLLGEGITENYKKAVEHYNTARTIRCQYQTGTYAYALATFRLGECYRNGWGVEKDNVQAYKLFSAVADSKHEAVKTLANLKLGIMRTLNLGFRCFLEYGGSNIDQALVHFRKVENQTANKWAQARAWYEIAEIYFYGKGNIEADNRIAYAYYAKAADQNANSWVKGKAQHWFMYDRTGF